MLCIVCVKALVVACGIGREVGVTAASAPAARRNRAEEVRNGLDAESAVAAVPATVVAAVAVTAAAVVASATAISVTAAPVHVIRGVDAAHKAVGEKIDGTSPVASATMVAVTAAVRLRREEIIDRIRKIVQKTTAHGIAARI